MIAPFRTLSAGTGATGYSGDGGQATSATVYGPAGIAVDSDGNVYFSDYINNRVRKITVSTGIIATFAGIGGTGYGGDSGAATSAAVFNPNGLCIDSSGTKPLHTKSNHYIHLFCRVGNLYIADYSNSRVRKVVVPTSIISTIAGFAPGFSGDGGSATSAALYNPAGVATDAAGKDYNWSTMQSKATNVLLSRYLH